MSTADHLALAGRVIGRALEMLEEDPDRACRALERLRDRLTGWSAAAAATERAAELEDEDAQLELDELQDEMAALLAELELVEEPGDPADHEASSDEEPKKS
jgi:hypothetical protein